MSNWDLVRTLEFELQLPREVCERIVEVVTDSRVFVTRAEMKDAEEKWENEVYIAESTIRELEETIEKVREVIG